MPQSFIDSPYLGKSAPWSSSPPGYLSPWDNQSLAAPRNSQGDWTGARWIPSAGDYMSPGGDWLSHPRITGSPVGSTAGTFGSVPGSNPFFNFGQGQSGFGGVGTTAGTGSGGPGQSNNPFTTLMNVKSPEIDAATGKLIGDWNTLQGSHPNDYLKALKETQPGFEAQAGKEAGLVDYFTGPQFGSDLAQRRAEENAAYSAARDYGVADSRRVLASAGLQRGGGASSYTNRLELGMTLPYNINEAIRQSEQRRQDEKMIHDFPLQVLGKHNELVQQALQRRMFPWQTQQQVMQGDIGTLAPISGLQQGNRFYGLTAPYNTNASYFVPTPSNPHVPAPGYSPRNTPPNSPYLPPYNPYAGPTVAGPRDYAPNFTERDWNDLFGSSPFTTPVSWSPYVNDLGPS